MIPNGPPVRVHLAQRRRKDATAHYMFTTVSRQHSDGNGVQKVDAISDVDSQPFEARFAQLILGDNFNPGFCSTDTDPNGKGSTGMGRTNPATTGGQSLGQRSGPDVPTYFGLLGFVVFANATAWDVRLVTPTNPQQVWLEWCEIGDTTDNVAQGTLYITGRRVA